MPNISTHSIHVPIQYNLTIEVSKKHAGMECVLVSAIFLKSTRGLSSSASIQQQFPFQQIDLMLFTAFYCLVNNLKRLISLPIVGPPQGLISTFAVSMPISRCIVPSSVGVNSPTLFNADAVFIIQEHVGR